MGGPALKTERFDLTRMLPGPQHCVACAERICAGVRELDGVADARCDAEAGELEVTYDPSVAPPTGLRIAVERRALEESDSVGHAAYRLTGLD